MDVLGLISTRRLRGHKQVSDRRERRYQDGQWGKPIDGIVGARMEQGEIDALVTRCGVKRWVFANVVYSHFRPIFAFLGNQPRS